MIDSSIDFQYVQEVCIMSTQYKNIVEVKSEKEKTRLSSKVTLTKKQLNKVGLDSLNAYATTSPEDYLGKFLDL
ncbi:hypothetical protein [Acinetobacter baumannii]|uniref:hypothetical protein n=1 Tax=Acinetobacter baumannii TaxID=470 RepID=UPI00293FC14A|nr:hypothetical protein [Acinetobacter baumannii]MDV4244213.1 hypothetical protein [Acinetobacter baumannii]